MWAIPAMVIILLGGVSWIGSHELDPARPLKAQAPPLDIQVVSLDWKWLFIYPQQGVASINELVVPAGVPLHFSLTSASVMNSFFVPELGSMIYTMNGMVTELNLMADAPGTLQGRSAHYSGDGFSDMHFEVRAVAAQEFPAWVAHARGSAAELDVSTYLGLEVQAGNAAPLIFGRVAPGLFRDIATQVIAPAPGPGPQLAQSAGADGVPGERVGQAHLGSDPDPPADRHGRLLGGGADHLRGARLDLHQRSLPLSVEGMADER